MKALVTYYSETGNTKKLAQSIYEGIKEKKKEILPLAEVKNIDNYDIIFCGFPVHSHSVPGKAESFLKEIPEGKKVALFATHGSLRGGEKAITAFYHALSLLKKITIIGTFGCQGMVKNKIIDALMEKAEHKAWTIEAQGSVGHPNSADLEDGKNFAGMMMTKAGRV